MDRPFRVPDETIKVTHQWIPGSLPYVPHKEPASKLNIGLIGSERLYKGLKFEATIQLLTPENWKSNLTYLKPDFVLVESCELTVTNHWHLAHSPLNDELKALIDLAKKISIPTVFWFTKDSKFHDLFCEILSHFDYVFCADEKEIEILARLGITADLLLPAVQPTMFNPLSQLGEPDHDANLVLFDGLADLIRHYDEIAPKLLPLRERGLAIFDSINRIWRSKTKPLKEFKDNLLGSVTYLDKIMLLKQAKCIIAFDKTDKTPTENEWLMLEAMATRTVYFLVGDGNRTKLENDLAYRVEDIEVELTRFNFDPLYRERVAHKQWREVVTNHTYANRLKEITTRLDLENCWIDFPKATLVCPTIRPHFMKRTIEQFKKQSYPNKQLVFVFNGDREELNNLPEEINHDGNIKLICMPKQRHAGACMNFGISNSDGEYCFRFDDDDFYGENYLNDFMLQIRVLDIDILGKSAQYLKLDDNELVYYRSMNGSKEFKVFNSNELEHSKIAISGCTIGGKKSLFITIPYPDDFACADSAWYHRANEKNLVGLVIDKFNMVFWRRNDGSHTWKWNPEKVISSDPPCFTIDDLMF